MNNTMLYKNYVGSIEFSEADKLFYGKVLGINALISYEGRDGAELLNDFHDAVEEYLAFCEEQCILPEQPYKGNFNVRLKPQTHQRAAIYAINNYISLNNLIELSVDSYLQAHA